VAFAGFGVDSLIEIVASAVVVWQLKGEAGSARERRALRVIAVAFVLLAVYIALQSAIVMSARSHPGRSVLGIAWLAVTVAVMFALAAGKRDTGRRLGNPVLETEARVTFIDGALAATVLLGVVLNAALGWWWADPLSALVILVYGAREARHPGRRRTDDRHARRAGAPARAGHLRGRRCAWPGRAHIAAADAPVAVDGIV
jgi:hypothetical protein